MKLTHNYVMERVLLNAGNAYIATSTQQNGDKLVAPDVIGATNAFIPEVRPLIEASFVMYQCLNQCVSHFENLLLAIDEGSVAVHESYKVSVEAALTQMRNDLMLVMQCAITGIPTKENNERL